jgi:hypothetical protein
MASEPSNKPTTALRKFENRGFIVLKLKKHTNEPARPAKPANNTASRDKKTMNLSTSVWKSHDDWKVIYLSLNISGIISSDVTNYARLV